MKGGVCCLSLPNSVFPWNIDPFPKKCYDWLHVPISAFCSSHILCSDNRDSKATTTCKDIIRGRDASAVHLTMALKCFFVHRAQKHLSKFKVNVALNENTATDVLRGVWNKNTFTVIYWI